MIETRDLVKHYDSVEAIRGVSFKVDAGEIVGLLGPNGAGKTTVMKILTCYHFPTSGTALVGSFDVWNDTMAVRRSVGYLPENAPLYHDLKVVEYLDFVADVRGFSRKERKPRVERAMELCGLTPMAYRTIEKLSKGYRQRVGLAQAIIHEPPILILDEPTTGLDPNQIVEIRALVRELGEEKTVILSTHIMQEVENLCKKVLILNKGQIVANGTADELGRSIGGRRKVVAVTFTGTPLAEVEAAFSDLPPDTTVTSCVETANSRIDVEVTLGADVPESDLSDWSVMHRFKIIGMAVKVMDLEEIFHALTQTEGKNA